MVIKSGLMYMAIGPHNSKALVLKVSTFLAALEARAYTACKRRT